MFIHNLTLEAFKFFPNDPSITTKCLKWRFSDSPNTSQPFSLEIFDRTFRISVQKKEKETQYKKFSHI